MKKVLIVEDEVKIARLVRDYLRQAGFDVVEATDGPSGLAMARAEKPDMIVLDLGLPEMDGLDVPRRLRATSSVPIIMLTARSEESDRIVGLELGADDYIVKPFSPGELVARTDPQAGVFVERVGHVAPVHEAVVPDGADAPRLGAAPVQGLDLGSETLDGLDIRLRENRARLESMRQKAELLAEESARARPAENWNIPDITVRDEDVEVAFLREKQQRRRS